MASTEDRYVFLVEWYDQPAALVRTYNLTYYTVDNSIDMVPYTQFDIKNKRIFLKRCQYPDISLADLFIGSTVTVYSRQLKLVDYGDVFTRRIFENQRQKTFAMIKPDAYMHIGKIVEAIRQSDFIIGKFRLHKFSREQAMEFYGEHRGKPFFDDLVRFITSDIVVGMELVGNNAIQRWRDLIGPTNTQVARTERPNSLRAFYGTDGTRNAVHGSDSISSAHRELGYFFELKGNPSFITSCTLCIIKPHAMQFMGQIIDIILSEGFQISAGQMIHLDEPTAEEFLDVYRGVLPEYIPIIQHLIAGQCLVLEIRKENAVTAFRELCGPNDPEIAKHLSPESIRARYGVDRVMNAVHCTDLPEDGPLESEYFFKLILNR